MMIPVLNSFNTEIKKGAFTIGGWDGKRYILMILCGAVMVSRQYLSSIRGCQVSNIGGRKWSEGVGKI
jgi:hypothetical protein